MSIRAADTRLQRVKEISNSHLTERQAARLVTLLRWWSTRLDHNKTDGGKCLPYTEIRERLFFRNTKALLTTGFFEATGWSHADHRQRAWTLTPLGLAAVEAIDDTPPEKSPEPTKRAGRPRTRAVNRIGKAGNRAPDIAISRTPELNTELAQQTLNHAADLSDTTRAQLQAALEGKISYDYRQTNTGRFQGQGIHLQGFTKQAIAALFPDAYDIDIENCHVVILQHLARQHGIDDTPTLDDYADNKRRWRNTIAKHCNADVKDIKQCLLSLIYSAMITGSDKTAIVETLGKDAAKRFVNHPDVIELHTELAYITRVVVRAARTTANRLGNIYNKAGARIHKSAQPKIIMAHIAQGIESKLMQLVVQKINVAAEVWKHDGAIIREPITDKELQLVCNQVEQETGFQISLEVEPLNPGYQTVQQCKTTRAAPPHNQSTIAEQREQEGKEERNPPTHHQPPQPNPQEERPLTEHFSLQPAYMLRLRLFNYGFVRGEKQADFGIISTRYSDVLEHQRAPP